MRKYLPIFLFLSGCVVGPDYRPPEYGISDEWVGQIDEWQEVVDAAPPITHWWIVLEDPQLDAYICMAAQYNNDVLTAEANILKARAMVKVTASALYPQILADFNGSRTYFSKNGPVFAANTFTQGTSPITGLPFQIQTPQMQNLFNALIDVSWEIDLFGQTQRSVEAACANFEATVEQKNDVLISVLAETARHYIDIRTNQQLGVLIQQNIDFLEQNLQVTKKRYQAGYSNSLDVFRLEAEVAAARASLPQILTNIYSGIYALATLTGNMPDCLADELLPLKALPALPLHVGVGLRSDILRRRPDVRYAERQFAASIANIGVAIASFYPSISLSGDIGLQSLKLSNWFSPSSKTWSYGGDINMPIFQGGALVGNLQINEASAAAAGYTYQQAILNAVQETETSLIAYEQSLQTIVLQKESLEKNRRVTRLTQERYAKGLVNVIDLLDAERQLNAAEQNLLQSHANALLNLIKLYKALGGGWEDDC